MSIVKVFIVCMFLWGIILHDTMSYDVQKNDNQECATFLIADSDNYDFSGVSSSGGIIRHKFVLTNVSNKPGYICAVATGCSCISASYSTGVVLPEHKTEVTVSVNPKMIKGVFHKRILLFVNGGRYYKMLSVKGLVK